MFLTTFLRTRLSGGSPSIKPKQFSETQAIPTRSYPFKLKPFDDIRIGNIISSPHDLQFYRIIQKTYKEVLEYGDVKPSYKVQKSLQGSFITDEEINMINRNQPQAYNKIATFDPDIIGFCPSFLVLDQCNPKKFFHQRDVKIGDIIMHLNDKHFYKVVGYKSEFSIDYGGAVYEWPFYELVEVNPLNNFSIIENSKNKINVGPYSFTVLKNYVVLETDPVL